MWLPHKSYIMEHFLSQIAFLILNRKEDLLSFRVQISEERGLYMTDNPTSLSNFLFCVMDVCVPSVYILK